MTQAITSLEKLRKQIPTRGNLSRDRWEKEGGQSFDNERKAFDTLIRLATQLGPTALLQHVSTKYATARKDESLKYAQRMFRYPVSGDTDTGVRSVLPVIESLFGEDGKPIHIRARADAQQSKKLHSRLAEDLATGDITSPKHPKEAVLEAIIAESPHLKNGGRILIICDDPQTAKYLSHRSKDWGPVIARAHSLASPSLRAALASPDNAYESPGDALEVIVLQPTQLERRKLNDATSIHAALTIVYNVGVNVKTGQPDLKPDVQVDIRTKQAIELTVGDQLVKRKEKLLRLQQVIDNAGNLEEKPDPYWDR
jgi:hypothetical protein